MTEVAVDWVSLPTPEFVAWTRLVGVALPYPLSTSDVAYVEGPERAETERILAARELSESPLLDATRVAFTAPRLIVYSVRVAPNREETKVAAIASREEDRGVLVLLDRQRVSLRAVADTELAAGVVGALPQLPVLAAPSTEVALSSLRTVDDLVAAGATARTIRAVMSQAGFPEALIALQEQTRPGPIGTGFLGAVGYDRDELLTTAGRHSSRSSTWREFPAGTLLQMERGTRRGEAIVMLTPFTPDAAFRAAVDAVNSVYEGR